MNSLGLRVLASPKLRVKFAKNTRLYRGCVDGAGVISHGQFRVPMVSVFSAVVHFENIPITIQAEN